MNENKTQAKINNELKIDNSINNKRNCKTPYPKSPILFKTENLKTNNTKTSDKIFIKDFPKTPKNRTNLNDFKVNKTIKTGSVLSATNDNSLLPIFKKEELNLDDPDLKVKIDKLIKNLEDMKVFMQQRNKGGTAESNSKTNSIISSCKSSKVTSSTSINNYDSSKKVNGKQYFVSKENISKLNVKSNNELNAIKIIIPKQ